MNSKSERVTARAAGPADSDTKRRIMDVALHLFAERGFDNVTTRQITQAADVNVAAVNYHFGSKLGLMKAVFVRSAAAVNVQRMERFAALSARKDLGPEDAADIIRAFIEPTFRTGTRPDEDLSYRRLMGRMSASANLEFRQMLFQTHDEAAHAFIKLLRAARPDLSTDDFFWRLTCIYGAMMYAQADNGRIRTLADDAFETNDMASALTHMIPFLAAGFTAPAMDDTGRPVGSAGRRERK